VTARFLSCGDSALVVEFGDRIDRHLSEEVLRLAARVAAARLAGVVEMVPTFRSLMVHYDPLVTSATELRAATEALLVGEATIGQAGRLWRVPVWYGAEATPDLPDVAARTGLTVDEVISLHAGTRYHVYMIGFLPGYPYMGDLPPELVLPRREDPRVRVPPGAVAIATSLTAIYSLESPGGWHLIGLTPIRLFDVRQPSPALLAPGDAVEFEPIDARRFATLKAVIERGDYQVPHERLDA
jgi:KipI family sensor histidine kinase inhibitor